MSSTRPRRTGISLIIGLVAVIGLVAGGSAAIAADADKEAARKAERQAFEASGQTSPSVVVDGTPRKSEKLPGGMIDRVYEFKEALGRSRGLDFAPKKPDDGPQRSLQTVLGEAGMAADLGGDDVIVGTDPNIRGMAYIDITSTGDYYAAVSAFTQLNVYKSEDEGETWTLWSSVVPPSGIVHWISDMVVAEGAQDRIFLAWQSNDFDGIVRVAYAAIGAAGPPWTIVDVLSDTGINHGGGGRIDIDVDDFAYNSYYVYVIAESGDGNGNDIWFSRSLDQGASYQPGYRIADTDSSSYEDFAEPQISFGDLDFVHACYLAADSTGVLTNDLNYRRIPNSGLGGLPNWEAAQIVKAEAAGIYYVPLAMKASLSDGTVIVSTLEVGGLGPSNNVFFSTDHGATWPPLNTAATGLLIGGPEPLFLPSGDVLLGSFDPSPNYQVQLAAASLSDLTSWFGPVTMADGPWDDAPSSRFEGLALDPVSGDVAIVWSTIETNGDHAVRFDGDWRRDLGFGNTDVGFPVEFTGGGQTPPAIAEIDGDAEGEIVFATRSGDIHILNHDGTTVPGWPVNIGQVPFDAPVAVGYNGPFPYIAMGNSVGEVYAFDAAGNLLPNFPVQMPDTANTFVSIGALGPPYPSYIVAVGGFEMRIIPPNGEWWEIPNNIYMFTSQLNRPAAIGDVDNDGNVEIVTVKGGFIHKHRLGFATHFGFRNFAPDILVDMATMADVDEDGDLEIAVPGNSGEMYLMEDDLSDYPGWPISVPSGSPLSSAAFNDVLGNDQVELAFAELGGTGLLHMYFINATEQPAYPNTFGSAVAFMPPIVYESSAFPGNVIMGNTLGHGYSYANVGDVPPGWPRNVLPDAIEETPAAGDIDNDGRNEIVFVSLTGVTVLDTGTPTGIFTPRPWPMYGYDPQRTGCFECFDDAPVAVGDDLPPSSADRSLALDVYPNPFNPSTTVSYSLPVAGRVSLRLYDVRGRLVDELVTESVTAGDHKMTYQPEVASGVYFLRLEAGGEVVTRKLGLLK